MWATKKQLRRDANLLKAENDALTTEIRALKTQLSTARLNGKEVPELRSKVDALKTQLAKEQKTVRKQTEADLLVNALQAVGIIPTPQICGTFDHFANAAELQSRLYNSNMSMQQQDALTRRHTVPLIQNPLRGGNGSFL